MRVLRIGLILASMVLLSNCASTTRPAGTQQMVVSASDQTLTLYEDGMRVRAYPVSTSKYGLGDQRGSYRTPTGKMIVAQKIGQGLPSGAVFKSRRFTGEVLRPNAPGRDPIVTRILWLRGTEPCNANAYRRCIYIHGTPEERNIGLPVSYGCIRMRSTDVLDLYRRVGVGAEVRVTPISVRSMTAGGATSASPSRERIKAG